VVIALVVTPEGLPLGYAVLSGNTADSTTLRGFLERIERQYGKARRIWLMDRGIPTEAVLAEMRAADPPVCYLVGTPKGRLTRLEQALLEKPWQEARPGVRVKLLPQDGELYVLAESRDRVAKERAMRRRQLRWLWKRLAQLAGAVDKFHLLKYGLAVVLVFVGLKMVWLNDAYGGKFPIVLSLGIIIGVIALSVTLSLMFPKAVEAAERVEGGN
jgi:hypothetical protein